MNDKLCHRLFIQAESHREALNIAEDLGCYWDGVANGVDCPCCGDRWSDYESVCEIEKYCNEGYRVGVYDGIYASAVEKWHERYGAYDIAERPKWESVYSVREYTGKIKFHNIEQYAQYLADEYGWTVPDVRIYYKDGTVKEIFSKKLKKD